MSKAALIIALLALVGTWGGPAVADSLFTGRDVKNGSLTGRDVRDRSLTGRDVRSNSLTGRVISGLSGRDLMADSVDGSDIAEETLDVRRARTAERADSAAFADALAGGGIAHVEASLLPATSDTPLELGGLTLDASCTAGSVLELRARTADGPALIRTSGIHRTGNSTAIAFAKDDEFQPGEEFDALAGAQDNLSGQLVYRAADGAVVTVSFLAEQGLGGPAGTGCVVAGTATHAAG